MRPRTAIILFAMLAIGAVLLGAFALANAAEVESVRESQYEWTCEDADGNLVSGHTRQDKAFQSCYNAALATGETYYVRGGAFRVSATGTEAPPPEPPPDPIPPDPDPTPTPQVTFGPLSTLTEYPATIGALKQDRFRWEVTFTLNSVAGRIGLASRDQSGTTDPGHLSLWVENGVLILRHQDACPNCGGSGEEVHIEATVPIVAGTEYHATVSINSNEGTALWLDGALEGSDPRSWGLTGNNLPLIVGGLCSSCKADGTVGPHNPIDGTVYMEIWDDALPLPQPTASLELRWTAPTLYETGDPIGPGELTAINLYQLSPGSRQKVAGVDPDQAAHEVTGLYAGTEYCFAATAVAVEESADSNTVCRSP